MMVPTTIPAVILEQQAVQASLLKLRDDAEARGHHESAIAYGWAVIRMNAEILFLRCQALREE